MKMRFVLVYFYGGKWNFHFYTGQIEWNGQRSKNLINEKRKSTMNAAKHVFTFQSGKVYLMTNCFQFGQQSIRLIVRMRVCCIPFATWQVWKTCDCTKQSLYKRIQLLHVSSFDFVHSFVRFFFSVHKDPMTRFKQLLSHHITFECFSMNWTKWKNEVKCTSEVWNK